MVSYRIEVDRELCVGAGMCVVAAPAVFDQDDVDGRVVLLDVSYDDEATLSLVREAVMLCPSGALSLSGVDPGAPPASH